MVLLELCTSVLDEYDNDTPMRVQEMGLKGMKTSMEDKNALRRCSCGRRSLRCRMVQAKNGTNFKLTPTEMKHPREITIYFNRIGSNNDSDTI